MKPRYAEVLVAFTAFVVLVACACIAVAWAVGR
jgi:Co/Zn/Cd efflux system component